MALAIGNKTAANATPAATSYTFAHNQDVGADGYLLVALCMSNTVNYTTVTYNGGNADG